MREKTIIVQGDYTTYSKVPKYTWIQSRVSPSDDRVLDGKFHPKITFLMMGYRSVSDKQNGICEIANLYGKENIAYDNTYCKIFPPPDQLTLFEEYGEVLTDLIDEETITNLIKELKIKCII